MAEICRIPGCGQQGSGQRLSNAQLILGTAVVSPLAHEFLEEPDQNYHILVYRTGNAAGAP